jgi:alkanesulfonate monooxygenase SsuD/methylene tetrahydromethanopterin reductase-like flavin-dependent oxidoreductase (luciferase family)
MILSVLDQVPVTEHTTADAAPRAGLELAREAERLGYHRIWFAEHHRSASFASPAPEIMAALAAERTTRIRVGTGGILLPLYQASKVAEVMALLAQVHGDRIDTGVGRAAVADPDYTAKIAALVQALGPRTTGDDDEPAGRVWTLGAGGASAPDAGAMGAGYAHGHFFVPRGGEQAFAAYTAAAARNGHRPHTILAVRAVAAKSPEQAQGLAQAMALWRARKDLGTDGPIPSVESVRRHQWTDQERTRAKARAAAIISGTPEQVHAQLTALAQAHGAEEVMINTLTSDPAHRRTSYTLLAEHFALAPGP